MLYPLTVISTLVAALVLVGCDKPLPKADPYTPPVMTGALPSVTPGGSGDTSVPAASAALTQAPPAGADPAAGRNNRSMTPAQETSAMPMPGQNNDHSAPLTPAKRASGP